ncbi:YesL family protein [Alkalihalobacillus hemicellulosilyticus]|uniref:YESV protein n=1 Tax=Halalkalibacter hemicellulosilyticusJCM 9152 TaxID=1236971 RepID=W4QBV3_9BACI|nr:DUF624 domain-containing protein [Halalkalibacter hemicellulosilyticus]GAE29536.1 hypothetical protein JCM9152_899 [Halalkalibacter hemicellulosilyticusJCM 9152]
MDRALYRILEWITLFAYLNVIWICFTLAGGIVLGLFPATIAMFSIIRKWLQGDSDKPILATFWHYYKDEFWKSNRLGFLIYFVSLVVGFNSFFLYVNHDEQLSWALGPLLAGILLFFVFMFYIFPVYVHFDLNLFQIVKSAFQIMLISPVQTLFIIVSLGAFYLIITVIPAVGVIFGASFYSLITLLFALNAFQKIQEKQNLR